MTEPVRDIQRESFRGYVVSGPQGARVCCGTPHCPEELRAQSVDWLLAELHARRWRDDQRLRGWQCPGCAP